MSNGAIDEAHRDCPGIAWLADGGFGRRLRIPRQRHRGARPRRHLHGQGRQPAGPPVQHRRPGQAARHQAAVRLELVVPDFEFTARRQLPRRERAERLALPWSGQPFPKVSNQAGPFYAPFLGLTTDFNYFDRWTFGFGVYGPSAFGNKVWGTTVHTAQGDFPSPQRYDVVQANLLTFFPTLRRGGAGDQVARRRPGAPSRRRHLRPVEHLAHRPRCDALPQPRVEQLRLADASSNHRLLRDRRPGHHVPPAPQHRHRRQRAPADRARHLGHCRRYAADGGDDPDPAGQGRVPHPPAAGGAARPALQVPRQRQLRARRHRGRRRLGRLELGGGRRRQDRTSRRSAPSATSTRR